MKHLKLLLALLLSSTGGFNHAYGQAPVLGGDLGGGADPGVCLVSCGTTKKMSANLKVSVSASGSLEFGLAGDGKGQFSKTWGVSITETIAYKVKNGKSCDDQGTVTVSVELNTADALSGGLDFGAGVLVANAKLGGALEIVGARGNSGNATASFSICKLKEAARGMAYSAALEQLAKKIQELLEAQLAQLRIMNPALNIVPKLVPPGTVQGARCAIKYGRTVANAPCVKTITDEIKVVLKNPKVFVEILTDGMLR